MNSSAGIIIGNDTVLPTNLLHHPAILSYQFVVQMNDQHLDQENIYEIMQHNKITNNVTVKTAHPSIAVFAELYKKGLKKFNSLIAIALSSNLSGCYNAMIQAKKLLAPKEQSQVYIIDSLTAGPGTGLLVSYAMDLIAQHQSNDYIYRSLETAVAKTSLFGMVENPFWLQASGRITPAIALILNQMAKVGIRPLLGMREGKITLLKVKMQAQDIVTAIVKHLVQETQGLSPAHIKLILTHANNRTSMLQLQQQIEQQRLGEIVGMGSLPPVLGAHVGPGTLFVGLLKNNF